jgi:hypothetical protein
MELRWHTGVVLTVSILLGKGAAAQAISPPLVRLAVPARPSAFAELDALTGLRRMRIWREGDPVRIKGDLRGGETLAPTPDTPPTVDPLIGNRTRMLSVLSIGAVTAAPPRAETNVDGIGATGFLPPDTVGDVGPNHYIQMVNSAFAVYDKGGRPLAGPAEINSLWKGFGGPCERENDGDPVVRYDHLADRWLVSQFALSRFKQCIAISRGPDPLTSGWHLYAFDTLDAAGKPVTPDYPKIGVWPDGYYMSTQRGFPSDGMDVWVFERERMLTGRAARQVQFSLAAPSIVLQPSDLDGPPPPAGTPNVFLRQVDGERFGGVDRLELYAFSVDWSDPARSTFKPRIALPVAAFDSVLCSATLGGACVPQPGTQQRLHTLSVWPMFRAQYRSQADHDTVLFSHTVDGSGAEQAAVRWYELRQAQGADWAVFQQGTHMPDSLHRWMGSVAMDGAGHITAAYSVAGTSTAPGLRAATRREADPPGVLGPELEIVAGGGSQTEPSSRWGDYASMDVDPANPCALWFTSLYYASTSAAGWRTRIVEIVPPGRSRNCNHLMPDVFGLTLDEATARLTRAGLRVEEAASRAPADGVGPLSKFLVTETSIPAGAELKSPLVGVRLILEQVRQEIR